jgi:hypothetical protein
MKNFLIAALILMGGLTFAQDESGTVGGEGLVTITLPATLPTCIVSEAGQPQIVAVGSDQACDDGDRHFTEINVTNVDTVTGIWYFVGSVGGTDSVTLELFTSAGVLLASTAASTVKYGAIVGTAAQIQSDAFTGGTVILQPGRYFISAQFSGTTAKFRSPTVPGAKFICDEDTGTAHTPASITPGTAFVADKGIFGGLY